MRAISNVRRQSTARIKGVDDIRRGGKKSAYNIHAIVSHPGKHVCPGSAHAARISYTGCPENARWRHVFLLRKLYRPITPHFSIFLAWYWECNYRICHPHLHESKFLNVYTISKYQESFNVFVILRWRFRWNIETRKRNKERVVSVMAAVVYPIMN